jgi:hypothetical protein
MKVNIEISKRADGKVRAKVFQGNSISHPLHIYPLAQLAYFEVCSFMLVLSSVHFDSKSVN